MCIINLLIYLFVGLLGLLGLVFVFRHQKYLGAAKEAEAVARRSRDIALKMQDVYENKGMWTVNYFNTEGKWMIEQAEKLWQSSQSHWLGNDWRGLVHWLPTS
jgi:hypothetical protein